MSRPVKIGLRILGVLAVTWLVLVLWVRPMSEGPPVFTIEDQIEIDASADEVWAVLTDFDRHAEWNPYLQSLTGDTAPGGTIEIRILQANWEAPMTLPETIVRREEGRLFHWHGTIGVRGLLETDHSFEIEPLSAGRVRFIHREEFRGLLAGQLDADSQEHTRQAFRAMDVALAERVAALRSLPPGP